MRSRAAREWVARWWRGELGAAGAALRLLTLPGEWAYGEAVRARNAAFSHGVLSVHDAGVPVISVGNLAVGGSGKTPVAAWLVQELLRRGRRPALLHGGYARDEPELHRRWSPGVPVIAQRDRVAAAAKARAAGADVLVLDDGFQHRRLGRDLDLVLVAAEQWCARPHLLPRGPAREPAAALQRAHLIAITRRTASEAEAAAVEEQVRRQAPRVPTMRVQLRPAGWLHEGSESAPPSEPALVVAAVAQPDAFLENALAAGATIADSCFWPDHHGYDRGDAGAVLEQAAGRPIVTTMKDWVKLDGLLPHAQVWLLRQVVDVEAGAALLARALDEVLVR